MMGYYGWNTFHQMSGVGWLVGILFWVVLIILVVGLIKWYISGTSKDHGSKIEDGEGKPLDILKERYAKGEITKREFLDMKKDIS
jgi:putative membrane protein